MRYQWKNPSLIVDFDQFITLLNKWKANWVHEGYPWLKKKKKNTKTTPVSAVLPPPDLLFLLRGQLQGSVRVRSMKVLTNQWHNYGSVHLAIFDHLWVFEIVSGLNCWFSHDVTKIQTKKLSILPRFYFQEALEQLKTNFHTNFCFKRVLGFVIEDA